MKTRTVGTAADRRLMFWCPACDEPHGPRIEGVNPWSWNGSRELPTLSPSVLVTYDGADKKTVCHSFVHNGRIQFLSDSTHALAGQTVDIPDWPTDFQIDGDTDTDPSRESD